MEKVQLFTKILCLVYLTGGLLLLGACTSTGTNTTDIEGTNSSARQTGRAEAYNGPKARIAVARIQNNSDNNFWYSPNIGDGMADRLAAALINSKRFVVLDRQALDDSLGEQNAGASSTLRQNAPALVGQIERAELLIVGSVTDFTRKDSGSQGGLGGSVLRSIAGGFKKARMAINLRIIDTQSSRVLAETKIEGESTDENLESDNGSGPLSGALAGWKNTAVEQALLSVIHQSVAFITENTPQSYYRHGDSSSRGNRQSSTPRSPLVREMQSILNSIGYDAGTADGITGNRTRIAVSNFQRDYGLRVTGKLDSKTIGKLRKIALR